MKSYLDPLKCPYCGKHSDCFVPPEIPKHPKLIIVGEAPGKEELAEHRPFVGPSGRVLRSVLPEEAIIVNATNCFSVDKPTTEIINQEREAHLLPIIAAYPHLPVVSLGKYAAQALVGGKRGDSSMAGQALWLYDRPVLFTYHPAYYLYQDKDPKILEHIRVHIKAALAAPLELEAQIDKLPPATKGGSFVLDVECSSADLPFYGAQMVLLGIRPQGTGIAYQFTVGWLHKQGNLRALQSWIDKQTRVVGHNVMYDILQSEALGLDFSQLQWHDTMIAEKDRGHDPFSGYGLKELARHQFEAPPWEAKFHSHLQAMKADKAKLLGIKDFPLADMSLYNAGDLYWTERLDEARSNNDPFTKLDNDYARYVKQMVQNGIFINQRKLSLTLGGYKKKLALAEEKARKMAGLGKDFNFGSWQQVLPVVHRYAGDDVPNTREQTLMTVYDKHPFISALLDVRGLEKTVEMLEGIKERIVKATGLLHTKATAHGAETGRLTTKEVNIQNWAKDYRHILVSRYPKGKIISPDLSQIEYRLIAHLTQESKLIKLFRDSGDIHSALCKAITGHMPKDEAERKVWKTVGYAEVYQVGLYKYIYLTGLPADVAKPLYYKAKGYYPAIDDFKADLADRLVSEDPMRLVNLFGRVRYISLKEFNGKNTKEKVRNAMREIFNWIFQSSGHDVMMLWTMETLDLIDDPKVLFINDVHDEFVLDVPGDKVGAVTEAIKFTSANLNDILEAAFGVHLRVPITAEIDADKCWH
jgi:uracil-DNA glycosylase family 4